MININNYLQNETNTLINECEVFFAFSDSQMQEGLKKINLSINDISSIGMGGFIPKTNKQKYIDGIKKIDDEYNKMLQDEKVKNSYILYQLHNHEAFYTGDIKSTLDAIGGENITNDDILKVYKSHNTAKCGCN